MTRGFFFSDIKDGFLTFVLSAGDDISDVPFRKYFSISAVTEPEVFTDPLFKFLFLASPDYSTIKQLFKSICQSGAIIEE